MTDSEALLLATILLLRSAIREYLEGYTSRGVKAEGRALKKLEKILEDTR